MVLIMSWNSGIFFSFNGILLSFHVAMKQALQIPQPLDGKIWFHRHYGTVYPMHRHDELEINLVTQGTGVYLLDDRKYALRRCSQVWLFPGQNHVLLDPSRDFEMWILVFKPTLLRRACTTEATRVLLKARPKGHFCKELSETSVRRLHALFREVMSVNVDTARFNAGLGYALLAAWAAQLASSELPSATEVHPAVERAVGLLRFEDQPLTLETLARRAGLSPSRLSRLFQAQIGASITAFRNQQRLDRFLTLYENGQKKNMLQAALEAGFGSYPQFHRIFKQSMACGPAEYRRRVTHGDIVRVGPPDRNQVNGSPISAAGQTGKTLVRSATKELK